MSEAAVAVALDDAQTVRSLASKPDGLRPAGFIAGGLEPSQGSRSAESDDEQTLIERCLAGDTESFRPFVQRHQRVAFSVALRMLGSRADAEDVAQQAFTDAYAALHRFRGDGRSNAFYAWLLRIVINRAKDVLKSKKRTEEPLATEVSGGHAMFTHEPGTPEARAGQAEDRRMLQEALIRIPPKYREVLVLKDVEGLSYEEIRSILRLPVTTLKIRVVRARARMRQELEALRR